MSSREASPAAAAAPAAALDKLTRLRALLSGYESVLVAFSGGVDSTFVLSVALEVLGPARVLAITGRSASVPQRELEEAARLAADLGAAHEFHDTQEFADANYLANPTNRCYFCKTELYGRLGDIAAARGLRTIINGVNADDLGDYRPGLRAAAEHAIRAPLAEAGITKAELRMLAALRGLPIHDKPASPCLSSRVQYGEAITPEKLRRIDAAETFLHEQGFRECRVRHHDTLARIEIPAGELPRLLDAGLRRAIDERLRALGYHYVTFDLRGFRSGSMNEVILGAGLAAHAIDASSQTAR